LAAVKAANPAYQLYLLTSPGYASLAERFDGLSGVWTLDPRAPWPVLWERARWLKHQQVDVVVNLHPSLKTRLLGAWLAPGRQAHYRKQKLHAFGQAQRGVSRIHAVEDFYLPFARCFGLNPLPRSERTPLLTVDRLAPMDAAEGTLHIALIPGVGHQRPNRAWPLSHFAQLAQQFLAWAETAQRPVQLHVFGGSAEVGLCAYLPPQVTDHCDRYDLLDTARWLRQCHLAIGGDTGPMHLAAALGVPCIGLYGPTSVARTGLLGRSSSPARCLTPPETLDCWPCEKPVCRDASPRVPGPCLAQISVDAVWEAAMTQLSPLL
jgi:ADP-heptose:LPS heptosyltransferase